MNKRSENRKRTARLHLRLTPEEKQVIERNAGNCGLSPGGMLRELGTGYTPRSVIDQQHIIELIHLRGDLGRAGGLLKLWLSEDKNMSLPSRQEINQWRDTILENQEALAEVINRIKLGAG